jgi:ribosomal protein S19
LCIYNGFRFVVVNISAKQKGFRLGEFSVTRRKPRHKGKKRQKKLKERLALTLLQQKKLKEKKKTKKK